MKRPLRNWILCLCLLLLLTTTARGIQVEPPFSKEAVLSALFEADIATTRRAITEGVVSCEELTAYYLERIDAYNEPYNCFITLCDNALDIARQRDEELTAGGGGGLLFGIPVVVKDNIHYEGYYTTNGFILDPSQISDSNAYVVERLLAEGAVIIGKTNMSTAADSARESTSEAVGETKNAYDPLLVAGGSSGGSAVAVSLNFAMAGLGTDTNASLRIPAVLNGCLSLRPTTGLISTEGIIPCDEARDIPGAITRTVMDQAIMLDVLTNSIYSFAENLNGNALEGLRLGIPTELLRMEDVSSDPEVQTVFYQAIRELTTSGAEVIPISMPELLEMADATFVWDDQPPMEALLAYCRQVLAENQLDGLIYPICTNTPIKSGMDENGVLWDAYEQDFASNAYVPSSAKLPAIALPVGYHSLGAGIGLEIVADQGQEQLLLDIAYSYTLRFDHRAVSDGAPNGYAAFDDGDLNRLIDAYIAAREAATEPTTVPTVEPTVEPTIEPTAAPTLPPAEKPATPQVNVWQWIVPVAAVLLVVDLGALVWVIFRKPKKKHRFDAT